MRASSAHAKTVPVISRLQTAIKLVALLPVTASGLAAPAAIAADALRCYSPAPPQVITRSVKAHAIVNRVITTTLRVPQAGSGYELSLRLDIHRETGSTEIGRASCRER